MGKDDNDSTNVILKQISALPHLSGDYQHCLTQYEDWEFRISSALKPNPNLLGYLSGNTDVAVPVLARPDVSARNATIAAMDTAPERRVAKAQLETEVSSWKKYDDFVLQSGILLTSIISIIDSGSNAYSLVQSDKTGTVKSIIAALRNRYKSDSATAVFRKIIDLRNTRIGDGGVTAYIDSLNLQAAALREIKEDVSDRECKLLLLQQLRNHGQDGLHLYQKLITDFTKLSFDDMGKICIEYQRDTALLEESAEGHGPKVFIAEDKKGKGGRNEKEKTLKAHNRFGKRLPLRGKVNNRQQAIDRATNNNGGAFCLNCKQKGHVAMDCNNEVVCNSCGKKGHFAKDCRGKRKRDDNNDEDSDEDDHDRKRQHSHRKVFKNNGGWGNRQSGRNNGGHNGRSGGRQGGNGRGRTGSDGEFAFVARVSSPTANQPIKAMVTKTTSSKLVIDSGAESHIISKDLAAKLKNDINKVAKTSKTVVFGNGTPVAADASICVGSLNDVLVCKDVNEGTDLVSVAKFDEAGGAVLFRTGKVEFFKDASKVKTSGKAFVTGERHGGLYLADVTQFVPNTSAVTVNKAVTKLRRYQGQSWHRALGHSVGYKKMITMAKHGTAKGLNKSHVTQLRKAFNGVPCLDCAVGDFPQFPVGQEDKEKSTYEPGEYLHIDIVDVGETSVGGHKYAVVANDEESSYNMEEFIKDKASNTIISCLHRIRRRMKFRSGRRVKKMHFDADSVFEASPVQDSLLEKGIDVGYSNPGEHRHSGAIERQAGVIQGGTRKVIHASSMPVKLWPYPMMQQNIIHNSVITDRFKHCPIRKYMSPKEILTGKKPDLMRLVPVGAACVSRIPNPRTLRKLDNRGRRGVVLANALQYNDGQGIFVYNLKTKRIVVSKDVKVDETRYGFTGKNINWHDGSSVTTLPQEQPTQQQESVDVDLFNWGDTMEVVQNESEGASVQEGSSFVQEGLDGRTEEGSSANQEGIHQLSRSTIKQRPNHSTNTSESNIKSRKRRVAEDEDAKGAAGQKKRKIKGANTLTKTASEETKKRQAKVKSKRKEKVKRRRIKKQATTQEDTFENPYAKSYSKPAGSTRRATSARVEEGDFDCFLRRKLHEQAWIRLGKVGKRALRATVQGKARKHAERRRVLITRILDDLDSDMDELGDIGPEAVMDRAFKAMAAKTIDPDIPRSYDEAMSDRFRENFEPAIEEELDSLRSKKVFGKGTKLPKGQKALGCRWVFDIKRNKDGSVARYKARLVAKGFTQIYGESYTDTFAATPSKEAIRLVLTLAAKYRLQTFQGDVKCAFLHGEMEEEVYCQFPEGWPHATEEGLVLPLLKSLYGTKQASRQWQKTLRNAMDSMVFKRCEADPCVFIKRDGDEFILAVVYVDDIFGVSNSTEMISQFNREIKKRFEYKDLGEINKLLGTWVTRRDDGSILVNCQREIEKLVEDYGMSRSKPAKSPAVKGLKLSPYQVGDERLGYEEHTLYQALVGSLLFIAISCRLDISTIISELGRFVSDPTTTHWNAAMKVLRYLNGTSDMGLVYHPLQSQSVSINLILVSFSDANWAESNDRKSTSGMLVQLVDAQEVSNEEGGVIGNVLSYRSKRQECVALSSTESEYIAASQATQSIVWIRRLLDELGFGSEEPTVLYEDNTACIFIAGDENLTQRTKHIDVRYHYIRDCIGNGIVVLRHISTELQLADIFTKCLDAPRFMELRDKVMGYLLDVM